MKTDANGRAFIAGFEDCILRAYDDYDDRVVLPGEQVRGTLTIGYGHTSAAGAPRVYIGMAITQTQAEAILDSDLSGVEIEVEHLVKVPLNQNQFDALVSFQFNTGWLAHPQCSLLRALNAGNYALTERDFALYDEASGKVNTGLQRRRQAEKLLFEGEVSAALAMAGVKENPVSTVAMAAGAAPSAAEAANASVTTRFMGDLRDLLARYPAS